MPEPDRTVQCPICDADFDPAVAGGWCTNPDCGEWQYDGDIEAADAGDVATGEGESADVELLEDTASAERFPSTPGPATNGHHSESETESKQASPDHSDAPVESPVETPQAEADDEQRRDTPTPDDESAGTDLTDDARADPTATGPDDQTDQADDGPVDDAEPAQTDADPVDDTATIDCPECGRELDADANFCLDCGADVRAVAAGGPDPLDACPECGTDVDDEASFCINCGENLDAHRDGVSEPGSAADVTDASAATDSSHGRSATDDAVEALSSQPPPESSVPDELVLSVAGRDIDVSDGDRVGREIRAALIDAGQPEDEALRIHREHVRFDREADGHYLVDLGDNPTKLNGTPLQKGDRERVEPGDELELSGVVTIAIRAR